MEGLETPSEVGPVFLDAAYAGNFKKILELVEAFEDGEGLGKVSYANLKTPEGRTALHMAAAAGKTSICKFLIENLNFNINATDNNGFTPLFPAITYSHQPTAIFLIKNGADVNKVGGRGITPMHRAAEKGSLEIMKHLISKGADSNAIALAGTPLHFAASGGNLNTLKFLLDLKADPNFNAPLHLTPLHMATSARSIECVELLLKAGADPNEDFSQIMVLPLFVAVCDQDEEMIKCLLNAGADPNMTDFWCKTALEYAALKDFREVVELLFPVTSRIAYYPDWSICRIMQYEQSQESSELRKSQVIKQIPLAKAKANKAFRRKDYAEAMCWYTQAVEASGHTDAKLLSNRSLCWTLLNVGETALEDAQACVRLAPDWAKAHYRKGKALKVLKRYEEAAEAFSRALALDPGNKEIENAYREALAE